MNADEIARRKVVDSTEHDSPENDPLNSDPEWRAFRYILGEMSPAEAEAFEEVLATDQAARELVARSTGLLTSLLELRADEATVDEATVDEAPVDEATVDGVGLQAAPVRPAPVRPALARDLAGREFAGRRSRGWAITGLVAAVCCCVAIGLCLIPLRGQRGFEEIYSGDLPDSADHLVAIWSQRLAELAPETATTEPAASERSERPLPGETDDSRSATTTENAPADSAAVADQIAADDSDVPGWMVAAVVEQARKPDGSTSEIREN